MKTYQRKQEEIFNLLEEKFKQGEKASEIVEKAEDFVLDNRICLTSVSFLPPEARERVISKVSEEFKKVDPNQYYHFPESLHITIRNIKVIAQPPTFNEEDIKKVDSLFKKIIPKYKSFNFHLKGLLDLPGALSVRGYSDEVLKDLVLELGKGLENIGVPDDKKYISSEIFFGNITFCRYYHSLNQEFKNKIKELKNIDLGICPVKEVSLITTNAVARPSKTKIISTYKLS